MELNRGSPDCGQFSMQRAIDYRLAGEHGQRGGGRSEHLNALSQADSGVGDEDFRAEGASRYLPGEEQAFDGADDDGGARPFLTPATRVSNLSVTYEFKDSRLWRIHSI